MPTFLTCRHLKNRKGREKGGGGGEVRNCLMLSRRKLWGEKEGGKKKKKKKKKKEGESWLYLSCEPSQKKAKRGKGRGGKEKGEKRGGEIGGDARRRLSLRCSPRRKGKRWGGKKIRGGGGKKKGEGSDNPLCRSFFSPLSTITCGPIQKGEGGGRDGGEKESLPPNLGKEGKGVGWKGRGGGRGVSVYARNKKDQKEAEKRERGRASAEEQRDGHQFSTFLRS